MAETRFQASREEDRPRGHAPSGDNDHTGGPHGEWRSRRFHRAAMDARRRAVEEGGIPSLVVIDPAVLHRIRQVLGRRDAGVGGQRGGASADAVGLAWPADREGSSL
jgi:hypothetical protein